MVTHQSKILPLENGDRLSRIEFERRYQAMPELKKAELIEARVYIASPFRIIHGQPHAHIMTWLGVYCAATIKALNQKALAKLYPSPNALSLTIAVLEQKSEYS